MAVVLVYWTDETREAVISDPYVIAAHLRRIGENARPCSRSGCKRPQGHGGRHYYTEDDSRAVPLHDYRNH